MRRLWSNRGSRRLDRIPPKRGVGDFRRPRGGLGSSDRKTRDPERRRIITNKFSQQLRLIKGVELCCRVDPGTNEVQRVPSQSALAPRPVQKASVNLACEEWPAISAILPRPNSHQTSESPSQAKSASQSPEQDAKESSRPQAQDAAARELSKSGAKKDEAKATKDLQSAMLEKETGPKTDTRSGDVCHLPLHQAESVSPVPPTTTKPGKIRKRASMAMRARPKSTEETDTRVKITGLTGSQELVHLLKKRFSDEYGRVVRAGNNSLD